jgi:hypothetical protein
MPIELVISCLSPVAWTGSSAEAMDVHPRTRKKAGNKKDILLFNAGSFWTTFIIIACPLLITLKQIPPTNTHTVRGISTLNYRIDFFLSRIK